MKDLRSAFTDNDFKRGFRCFCNDEMNIENLLFYEQVEDYRRKVHALANKVRRSKGATTSRQRASDDAHQTKKTTKKKNKLNCAMQHARTSTSHNLCPFFCQQIKRTFVIRGSPAEVNIPGKKRDELVQAFKNSNNSNNSLISAAMFEKAQEEVYKIMNTDIFPRFQYSDLGRALMYSRVNKSYEEFVGEGLKGSVLAKEEETQSKKEEFSDAPLDFSGSPSGSGEGGTQRKKKCSIMSARFSVPHLSSSPKAKGLDA